MRAEKYTQLMNSKDKTNARVRGISQEIQETASTLRHSLTPSEQILWNALRDRQLSGLKFRRQHPVGGFVLDFYCPSHKLIVELDGEVHDGQTEHDEERTKRLQDYGCKVIRFRNEEVQNNLKSVLEKIMEAVSG